MEEILNLNDAAQLLHMHEQTLREKARAGLIPAAKPGKKWIFVKEDLFSYLRGQYKTCLHESKVTHTGDKSCYTNDLTRNIGGAVSLHQMESEYNSRLKLRTKKKLKCS